ncbi:restriction endonuclease subunit S [Marinobacterium stanieri]|uniref:restriction endonuclease subunit S n=1 Tax=Marinobacterium stanieri TaxID=49186 RepID=UPI003A90BC14
MTSQTIPDSWKLTKISEIAVKGQQRKPDAGEQFTYVDIGSIDRNQKKIADPQTLNGDQAPSRARKVIEKGDVLVSLTRPNLNAVALVSQEYHNQIASTGFEVVKPLLVDSRYIFALVRSKVFVDEISGVVQGALYPAAKSADVQNFEFPLPPPAEQKVIADKLDALLAQVESTKARLDRIPQILKRFRQSVLAAAVSGRLTEEWRNSSSYCTHEFSNDWKWATIPQGWDVKLYPEVVESRLGKMLDKTKNAGIPTKYLGNINVRWFAFNLSEMQEILVSETEQLELSVKQGDVLICEGGEPGRCAIWDDDGEELIVFQKALHRARVSDKLLPEWLALNLKNDADNLSLAQLFTGTTIKHLTGKALKKYPIRVPPIEEQTEIVRRVDQLFAYADRIEQQVNNALERVNNLTQSVLAKAFRGELTEQWRKDNPELISGENSAEALLERIKAERAAMKPARKPRRKSAKA